MNSTGLGARSRLIWGLAAAAAAGLLACDESRAPSGFLGDGSPEDTAARADLGAAVDLPPEDGQTVPGDLSTGIDARFPPPAVKYFEPPLSGAAAGRVLKVSKGTTAGDLKSFIEDGGGTIRVPAGTFAFPSASWSKINFKHDVHIIGEGKGRSFIDSDWDRHADVRGSKTAVFGRRGGNNVVLFKHLTFRSWRGIFTGYSKTGSFPDADIVSQEGNNAQLLDAPWHMYNVGFKNVGRIFAGRVDRLNNVRAWHCDGDGMYHVFARRSNLPTGHPSVEAMQDFFWYDCRFRDLYQPEDPRDPTLGTWAFYQIGFLTGQNLQDGGAKPWAKRIQYQNLTFDGANSHVDPPHIKHSIELLSFQGTTDDSNWAQNILVRNLAQSVKGDNPSTVQNHVSVVYGKGTYKLKNIYVKGFTGGGQGLFTNKGGGDVHQATVANGFGYPFTSVENIYLGDGRRSVNWKKDTVNNNSYNGRGVYGIFGFRSFHDTVLRNVFIEDVDIAEGGGGLFFPDSSNHGDNVRLEGFTLLRLEVPGPVINACGQADAGDILSWTLDNVRAEDVASEQTGIIALVGHTRGPSRRALTATRLYLKPKDTVSKGYLLHNSRTDADNQWSVTKAPTGRVDSVNQAYAKGGAGLGGDTPLSSPLAKSQIPGANLDWVPIEIDPRGSPTAMWVGAHPDRSWKEPPP